MSSRSIPRVGMLWEQFAAYHVDRVQAVARRLEGRAEVLAVEVATTSATYAWSPSGNVEGASKLTLFPGASYERIGRIRRWRAQFAALWRCRVVLVGVSYAEPDIVLLSWALRLIGRKVVVMTESKFDDRQRSVFGEMLKAMALACYSAAIVGGRRQASYMRFLGFRRRLVLPGYDCVDVQRIRDQARTRHGQSAPSFAERDFIYVGRFVRKKNLETLLDAYAEYVRQAGPAARWLRLVGSGPLEAVLRERCERLGLGERVVFHGFREAEEVSGLLAGALALILPSREEQWGLVVNEALAVGLPVVVSSAVGSRDALVRNLINGFVIEPGSSVGLAEAFARIASDEELWKRLSVQSQERAWLGDAERLADAVELLLDPQSERAREGLGRFGAALDEVD